MREYIVHMIFVKGVGAIHWVLYIPERNRYYVTWILKRPSAITPNFSMVKITRCFPKVLF